MGLSKLWAKDSDGSRGFVFSHVKTIYYNWAQKKLLSTKLDEIDALIDQKIAKAMMSNVQVNDQNKVPTSALAYAMQQQITENEEAITGLNSDLDDRVPVSDLKAVVDQSERVPLIVQCDINTLNTPYKDGLTSSASGTAYITGGNDSGFLTILYIPASDPNIYIRSRAAGVWYDWYKIIKTNDLSEYFRNDTNGNNYIFSRYEYPRATIIETADGDIILRSSTSEGTYNQIRISDTSMYIDWVASGESTVTKKIISKND